MYLLPLEPPVKMIILNDPFVEFFGTGQTLTKDLFFSGHTATLFILFLVSEKKIIKTVFLISTIAVAISVLLQHVHYTIDVFAAVFFTYACYKLLNYFKLGRESKMKKLILFVCCSFLTDISTAQRVEFFGGIEFSKSLFSGKEYSNPGAIVGFAFENFLTKILKILNMHLEFSVNHVLTIDTRSYRYRTQGDLNDYLIVDQEFYYTSFEFAFLVKFKNLFGEGLPFIYSGLSIRYWNSAELKVKNKIPFRNWYYVSA